MLFCSCSLCPIPPSQGPPSLQHPDLPVPPWPFHERGRRVSCLHLELFTVLPCPFLSSSRCRSPGTRGLTCGGTNSCRRQGMSVSLSGVMLRTRSSSCTPAAPQANPRQVCVCVYVLWRGEKRVSQEAYNNTNFTLQH